MRGNNNELRNRVSMERTNHVVRLATWGSSWAVYVSAEIVGIMFDALWID